MRNRCNSLSGVCHENQLCPAKQWSAPLFRAFVGKQCRHLSYGAALWERQLSFGCLCPVPSGGNSLSSFCHENQRQLSFGCCPKKLLLVGKVFEFRSTEAFEVYRTVSQYFVWPQFHQEVLERDAMPGHGTLNSKTLRLCLNCLQLTVYLLVTSRISIALNCTTHSQPLPPADCPIDRRTICSYDVCRNENSTTSAFYVGCSKEKRVWLRLNVFAGDLLWKMHWIVVQSHTEHSATHSKLMKNAVGTHDAI